MKVNVADEEVYPVYYLKKESGCLTSDADFSEEEIEDLHRVFREWMVWQNRLAGEYAKWNEYEIANGAYVWDGEWDT